MINVHLNSYLRCLLSLQLKVFGVEKSLFSLVFHPFSFVLFLSSLSSYYVHSCMISNSKMISMQRSRSKYVMLYLSISAEKG